MHAKSHKFLNKLPTVTAPPDVEEQILGTKKHVYFLLPLHSSATLSLLLYSLCFLQRDFSLH